MIFNQVNFNFHCDIKPKLAIMSVIFGNPLYYNIKMPYNEHKWYW